MEENSHWDKERWGKEKQNTEKCLVQTEELLAEIEEVPEADIQEAKRMQRIMAVKEKLDKKEDKEKYRDFLRGRIKDIDKKIREVKK